MHRIGSFLSPSEATSLSISPQNKGTFAVDDGLIFDIMVYHSRRKFGFLSVYLLDSILILIVFQSSCFSNFGHQIGQMWQSSTIIPGQWRIYIVNFGRAHPPVQFSSFSCSFQENWAVGFAPLAKSQTRPCTARKQDLSDYKVTLGHCGRAANICISIS